MVCLEFEPGAAGWKADESTELRRHPLLNDFSQKYHWDCCYKAVKLFNACSAGYLLQCSLPFSISLCTNWDCSYDDKLHSTTLNVPFCFCIMKVALMPGVLIFCHYVLHRDHCLFILYSTSFSKVLLKHLLSNTLFWNTNCLQLLTSSIQSNFTFNLKEAGFGPF